MCIRTYIYTRKADAISNPLRNSMSLSGATARTIYRKLSLMFT